LAFSITGNDPFYGRKEEGSVRTLCKNKYSTSIIIPARNEEGNIKQAFERIQRIGKSTEIIFVEGNLAIIPPRKLISRSRRIPIKSSPPETNRESKVTLSVWSFSCKWRCVDDPGC
jgi:hypothetical protein